MRGTWMAGDEPATQQQPVQPAVDYSIESKEHLMEIKAVAIIKRLYGIRGPFDWNHAIHDRKARSVFDMLMRGEDLPQHWRTQREDPAPIDPSTWSYPRQVSR